MFQFYKLILFVIKLLCLSKIVFCDIKTYMDDSNQLNKTNSTFRIEPKVIGGQRSVIKGNEHMVSIHVKPIDIPFGRGHYCGGSLYKPNVVLTAAHCIYLLPTFSRKWKPDELLVVMGTTDRYSTMQAVKRNVKKAIVHENFNFMTFENDIAVLILSEPFSFGSTIKNISVADKYNLTTGVMASLSGWGKDSFTNDLGSSWLLNTTIPIVDHTKCKQVYQNTPRKSPDVTDKIFCAGSTNRFACNGDSGGPLIVNGTQYGIVSWGLCQQGYWDYPTVFTNVAKYNDWIKTNSSNQIFNGKYSILGAVLINFILYWNYVF